MNDVLHYTISQLDAVEALDVGSLSLSYHQTSKIQYLIEDTVTPILQTHHVVITNLLKTIGSSPTSNSLQGVSLPHSRGAFQWSSWWYSLSWYAFYWFYFFGIFEGIQSNGFRFFQGWALNNILMACSIGFSDISFAMYFYCKPVFGLGGGIWLPYF